MKASSKNWTKARFAIAGLLTILLASSTFVDSPKITWRDGSRAPAAVSLKKAQDKLSSLRGKIRGMVDRAGNIFDDRTQDFEKLLDDAEREGIKIDDLLPGIKTPKPLLSEEIQAIRYMREEAPRLKNEFGKKLVNAMEFIDLEDLLLAMAQGDTEPWRRYDEAGKRMLLDRWNEATDPHRPIKKVLDIFRIFSENPNGDYRDHEIVAGGDIFVDGKGYYRIDETQKAALEKNPYLTLDIRPDPYSPGKNLYLGRHEYPSAGNYLKFKDRLSADLVSRLESAGADLKNPVSPRFKELTRDIVHELIEKTETSPMSAIKKYQDLISIHPFSDFNGRSMRAYYKRMTGNPLFMWSFDEDLFSTYPEFVAQVRVGDSEHMAILYSLSQAEKDNPSFPDFYRAVTAWQVGARIPSKIVARQEFIHWIQEAYRRGDLQDLIRQKRFPEFVEKAGDICETRYRELTGTSP